MSNFLPPKSHTVNIELDADQVDFVIKAIDEQIRILKNFKDEMLNSAKILDPSGIDVKIKEQIKTYEAWKKQFNELKKHWK
jgi:hypothetical protein